MEQSSSNCLDVVECIAYSLATTATATPTSSNDAAAAAAAAAVGQPNNINNMNPSNRLLLQTLKSHLHPHERILIRGMEHTISPTVLKLMAHRRRVVIRRIVTEQGRLRQLCQQQQGGGGGGGGGEGNHSLIIRRDEALAHYSRENTAFAREWAVLKLLEED